MTAATTPQQTSSDEGAILTLLAGLRQAHHDKDGSAIAACYAANAVICDLAPPLAHHGVDVADKQAWLDSWEGPIGIEPRDNTLTIDGDTAIMQGYTRMSGTPKAAGRPIGFWLRDTICLKRGNGAWRIVHHHSSVPFYMDGSLRPAFDLQP